MEQVAAHAEDGDLRRLVRGFEGTWPYLELIAGAAGFGDPLDRRVVEAYWVGNDLLDRDGPTAMGRSLDDRFRDRLGRRAFGRLVDAYPREPCRTTAFTRSGCTRGRPAARWPGRCCAARHLAPSLPGLRSVDAWLLANLPVSGRTSLSAGTRPTSPNGSVSIPACR